MVGGHTQISFSRRHYFDLSCNPPQRTSAEIRVVQSVQTIITAHSKAWKKNCPIHFPDFNLESFFIEKYIYYKSLIDFRKMVETSVDIVPLRLTLQLPEYLLQIPQVVFHAEEAAAWLVSAYYYQKMLMNVVILRITY